MKSALKQASTGAWTGRALPADLLARYECGPVRFSGDANASYDRHLVFDHVIRPGDALPRERFEARARSARDLISQRWLKTGEVYDRENPKQVYYLSMEYLIGRSMSNNLVNLLVEPFVREAARGPGVDLDRLGEEEPDAGLGNGGLGRLAACFLDSMATLAIPAVGYGLRSEYGIFRQEIEGGRQVERPDHWLRRPDPWEVDRPAEAVDVRVDCAVRSQGAAPVLVPDAPTVLRGVPYDRPVVGYGGRTVNTLRLWRATATDAFDFAEFSGGDFFGAVHGTVTAESLTRVLYPDDSTPAGEDNFFLFGLTAEQVPGSRGWYDPRWHVEHEPETRRALELIRSGMFDWGEPGLFTPILDALLIHGDHYMHLADLTVYVKAQEQAGDLYRRPDAWARRAILNVGHSGPFSSDRTIAEYSAEIWKAEPCPVD